VLPLTNLDIFGKSTKLPEWELWTGSDPRCWCYKQVEEE
jgi:hypothetical protein